MAEPTLIQSIDDDRSVAASQRLATAAEGGTVAHVRVASAQEIIAQSFATSAQSSAITAQAATSSATSAATHAVASTKIADAQTQLATQVARHADAAEKLVSFDHEPALNHSVWLSFAVARSRQLDQKVASVPEVCAYADKMVAEYRKRYPALTPPPNLDAAGLERWKILNQPAAK